VTSIRSSRRHPRSLLALAVVAATIGACSSAATPSPGESASAVPATPSQATATVSPSAVPTSGPTSGQSSGTPGTVTKLTVGLGYIPSVQFAPFYLAQQAGYYRDAGLEVTFQNTIDPNLITLVGQGAIDIGLADGTSLIPAVAQGIPVRYVTTIYARFPNIVFAKASAGITTAADLRGKKLGTPGRYGSGWFMLEALLQSAGLTPSDLDIQLYPDYGQGAALAQGAIDAATGFANNEPVQLQLTGTTPTVLTVDDIVPLPGNGLISSVDTLRTKHAALAAFVAATLRAMADIMADPQQGIDATVALVPDLGKDVATQRAILDATIAMWSNDYTTANGLGAIDRGAWQQSVTFMAGLPGSPIGGTAPSVDQLLDGTLLAP
jgi:NitT/TauT family transport system substrate-binding protein